MSRLKAPAIAGAVGVVLVAGWLAHFHNAGLRARLPSWRWLQSAVGWLGPRSEAAAEEDEDPDNTKNEIPVHTAKVTVGTVHKYVDGFGTVAPRPPRPGEPGGAANLASPVVGVVANVLCRVGQPVKAGDVLVQLDDRLAAAAEEQASATLQQAEASLATLRATPRPEQLQIAKLNVEKSQAAVDFAQHAYDRLKLLAESQSTTGKSVEQAALDLAGARSDLAVNQRQLAILVASPTPEELRQEEAKVTQAKAAARAAGVQRQMLRLTSPIDATVVAVGVNAGEGVDTTRTLVQLVALDRLVVNVDVPAQELPEKAEGLAVQLYADTSTGTAAGQSASADPPVGKVTVVGPVVNAANNAVTLGVDVPADSRLRPGQTVRVRVVADTHADCLTVPREAVVTDENGDSVISLVEGSQATHKTVRVGYEERGQVEIIADDVKEGATVVTAGAFGLPAATRVKVLDP